MRTPEDVDIEIEKLKKLKETLYTSRRASIEVKHKFTFIPNPESVTYDELLDPSLKWWRLNHEVLNLEECKRADLDSYDVGHKEGKTYLVNEGNWKIALPWTTTKSADWIVNRIWKDDKLAQREAEEDAARVYAELAQFARMNPAGGDVTAIITSQRHLAHAKHWR